jgi:hypothetical protein
MVSTANINTNGAALDSPTRKKRPQRRAEAMAQRLSYANRDLVEELPRDLKSGERFDLARGFARS